jgi:uncharacterized LabA/DUF88 family protein
VRRVMVFIDGFNLYYGLRTRFRRRYYWLDVQALSVALLKEDQQLTRVKYFTARVRNNQDSLQRQSDYLDALAAHCDKLEIVSGRFQEKRRSCATCNATWVGYEEKETDVSIAAALLEHGVNDDFDVAMLVSGDSDLCPAVRALRRLRPHKRVVAAFPPARSSAELRTAATAAFQIGDAKVRQSQLPEIVTSNAGVTLKRPAHWR